MWKEILDFISPQLKWLKTKKKEQTNKINMLMVSMDVGKEEF